jgi:hypothetical protein
MASYVKEILAIYSMWNFRQWLIYAILTPPGQLHFHMRTSFAFKKICVHPKVIGSWNFSSMARVWLL